MSLQRLPSSSVTAYALLHEHVVASLLDCCFAILNAFHLSAAVVAAIVVVVVVAIAVAAVAVAVAVTVAVVVELVVVVLVALVLVLGLAPDVCPHFRVANCRGTRQGAVNRCLRVRETWSRNCKVLKMEVHEMLAGPANAPGPLLRVQAASASKKEVCSQRSFGETLSW